MTLYLLTVPDQIFALPDIVFFSVFTCRKMQCFALALCVLVISGYYVLSRRSRKRLQVVPVKSERVVIVGCSSGIGEELALQYAVRGARLALFARRADRLESLSTRCKLLGATDVVVVPGDVARNEDLERLVEETRTHLEGVDTVIYCAGLISVRPFLEACGVQASDVCSVTEQRASDLDRAIETITTVNYTAAVRLMRMVLPLLIKSSRAPNVMVMSSLAGKVGAPTRSLYAGSKHALHGFFDSLRVEVEPYGVHVGIICPGTVNTELRHTAVDSKLGTGVVAGSKRGKLTPKQVARRTLEASDRREREVYIPATMGYAALWGKLLASSWVDWAAKKKYKL